MNSTNETFVGKIKFFNETRGYGFILVDGSQKEIFVHATGLVDGYKPRQDDKVSFNTQDGKKGKLAVNVMESEPD